MRLLWFGGPVAEPESERLSPDMVKQVRQALRLALRELLLSGPPKRFSVEALW